VHVSPFHFCKIFKRATGMTFTDFVNRARVEKARKMLMCPEARITEVAYDVGFQSLSHLTVASAASPVSRRRNSAAVCARRVA